MNPSSSFKNPAEFIARWKDGNHTERQGAQEHFLDLCHLFGHPTPREMDKTGRDFTFERLVAMPEKTAKRGKKAHGWADVYKKNFFAWEYKKPGASLDKAFEQLKLYKDELENPPLLVVSDFTSFRIHTNFNNAPREVRSFSIDSLVEPVIFDQLRSVFWNPEALRPERTIEKISLGTAAKLADIARLAITRNEKRVQEQGLPTEGIAQSVARYLDRIVFCLFAEDIGLLSDGVYEKGEGVFSEIVKRYGHSPQQFAAQTSTLFRTMSEGGFFGVSVIPHFNGALFVNEPVIELSARELEAVKDAAKLNWRDVDPSIFGTLFEHGLNTDERSLLGAHYTGRGDIETLVNPVILEPLRREWKAVRAALDKIDDEMETGEQPKAQGQHEQKMWLEKWLTRLEGVRVLDPACGSGNFLSVTLGALLDLEKQALTWATEAGLKSLDGQHFETRIRPEAMLGLEKNEYAQDLARTVVQITYLQWLHENGYPAPKAPILRHTDNITLTDALFDEATGIETQWPDAEFIVGNPPFLGGSKIWRELGRPYQLQLWRAFDGRVPGGADLCCYWFDKAARHIKGGHAQRAGLVATQAIRGGANRRVLETIKESGDIFFAVSDRDWALGGATVHISLVAFDDGTQQPPVLDGASVERIFTNLTATVDVTEASPLEENAGICFIGTKKAGDFNLPESEATLWLEVPNVHGKPNSDVLRPWRNGMALTQRPDAQWIISPSIGMAREELEFYEQPYFRVDSLVRPERMNNQEERARRLWWQHRRPAEDMQTATALLPRYIATPRVSKFRVFTWLPSEILPDDGVYIFARSDDFFFGVLHSKIHEIWARAQGTQVRERESGFRYTPSTCFDTFPFPDAPPEERHAVAEAAAKLNDLREKWLNPPEWMKEEAIEFRASENGPWQRHLVPDSVGADGIGMARWTRKVPISAKRPVQDSRYDPRAGTFRPYAVTTEDALSHRTLTALYNHPPAWLQSAHRTLDEAVFAAYDWPSDLEEEEVLNRLLTLNKERRPATEEHNTIPRIPPRNGQLSEEHLDAD